MRPSWTEAMQHLHMSLLGEGLALALMGADHCFLTQHSSISFIVSLSFIVQLMLGTSRSAPQTVMARDRPWR